MDKAPPPIEIKTKNFRLVPSKYPPIKIFEHLLNADELDTAYALEALTNDRLRDEAGDISFVTREDRLVGPGTTPIMAAFTHIHRPTRFTDGSYGVYYAGLAIQTAIKESVYHRENFLSATQESACKITMRCYISKTVKPLDDIRGEKYVLLHNPDDYSAPQAFGKSQRQALSWGLMYNSVRHPNGECVAIFRPPALEPTVQGMHYDFYWNGSVIDHVMELKEINFNT